MQRSFWLFIFSQPVFVAKFSLKAFIITRNRRGRRAVAEKTKKPDPETDRAWYK